MKTTPRQTSLRNPIPHLLWPLLLVAAWLGSSPTARADYWILGGVGDWNVATNWSGGVVPNTGGGWAIGEVINGTAIISNTVPNVSEAWAGNNGVAGGIIVANGGVLNVDNWLVAARNGGGGNTPLSAIRVEGGTVNKGGDGFLIGEDGNCRGQLIITGNGVINVTGGWFGVGNGSGWGWLYLRDNGQLLLADDRDFNIGDWGTARGWCYVQDNARIDVRKFWVGKNDTAGVMIQSGGLVQGFTPTANEWRIGEGANAYGFYSLSGGTFSNPNNLHIGANGKGLFYQSGGTNFEGGWCAPGRYASGYGIVHLTGGRFVHNGASTHLFCAEQGRGEINVSGSGVLDCNLSLVVAHAYDGATGNGTLNVNGGIVRVPRFERWGDAPGGLAYVSLNGGVIQAKASEAAFLENMTATYVYAGGAIFDSAGFDITVNQPLLGPTGDGLASIPVTDGGSGYMGPPIVNLTGGGGSGATAVAIMADDGLGAGTYRVDSIVVTCPGHDFTSAPTVTLSGGLPATAATLGTPTLGPVTSGGLTKLGSGVLTFGGANTFAGPTLVSGGTLRANQFNTLSATANLNVALGATFDLNSFDHEVGSLSGQGSVALGSAGLTCGGDNSSTVFSGALIGDGQVYKTGSGTLTLSGPNHYSGSTVIRQGKLATTTASAGAGDIWMYEHAAFGLEVLAANAQIHPANLVLDEARPASLDFDLGAFGNPSDAPLDVTDTLTVHGVFTVNVAAANLSVGQFPLIKYGARSGVGSFVVGALPPRLLAQIVTNELNSSIDLKVISFESPKWSGVVPGGVWDIGLTPNWVGASSGTPTTFADGDLVLFDDSAPGTTTVDLGIIVQPASVTINNTNLSYTLTGTGKISGSAGVTKNGTGDVTLGNTGGNDFSGATVINAGTVAVGAAHALSPNSPVTVNSGALDIQGHNQAIGSITLAGGSIAGSSGKLSASNFDVRSGSVSANLGGAGALTKSTPGTVALSGANDYSGATVVNAGTLSAGAADTLSANSPITISGGTLDLQTHDQAAGPVTLVSGNLAGTATLTAPSFNVESGTVAAHLAGPGSLTKSGGGTATVNGDLLQSGQTIVNGGTLVLNGHNTYGGDTVINSGVAAVRADGNLGAGNLVLNPGGTLRVDGTTSFVSARNIVFGTTAWNGGTFDVTDGSLALFSGAMTGAGNDTYFFKEGAGTMVYSGTTAFNDATHFFVNRGLLVLSNATLSVNRWSGVGNAAGADAALALAGNSSLTVLHDFNVGDVTPSRARFYLADNARLVCNALDIGKPANCVGAAYQVGGVIQNAASWVADWRIGGQWGTTDVGAYGFYLLAGGAMTNVINNWQVGAYAQGVYYQTAGVNVQGGWAAFGRFGGSPSYGHGIGYLTGGQFIHSEAGQHLIIAEQGRGEFTVAGSAAVDLASALWVGLDYDGLAGHGTVNLNGGTLAAPAVLKTGPAASGFLNFNGGTLRAKADDANFVAGFTAAYVYAGGAVIDSGVHTIAIPQALLAPDGDGVGRITVDTAGSGYIGAPIVIITGDGSGATAVAEIDYLAGTVTNIVVTSPGRGYTTATVTLSGGGGAGASATAILGPNVSGGLTKLGSGTLSLTGINTFTGPVLVREGTLVNDGIFADAVTVESAGALDLGPGIEDLSVAGALALSGTLYLDINRDTLTGDFVFGAPSANLGGRLVVRNLGSALQLGDAFWLIDAASFDGTFAQLELPPLAPGLAWDIPSFLTTGVLEVKQAAPQTISSYRRDPATGNMEFEFTGNPGYAYRIEATTNLNTPIVWETLSTNVADLVTGLFRFLDTNAPAYPQRFYRTVTP